MQLGHTARLGVSVCLCPPPWQSWQLAQRFHIHFHPSPHRSDQVFVGFGLFFLPWTSISPSPSSPLLGEVARFTPVSAVLQDGTELDVDVVLVGAGMEEARRGELVNRCTGPHLVQLCQVHVSRRCCTWYLSYLYPPVQHLC